MDKQIKFMRKLIADLVEDARLRKTSMASIVGNGNFVAEQIMNDVYNQALDDFTRQLSVRLVELPLDDLIVADILNDAKEIYEHLKK